MSYLDQLRSKISANPLFSALASAAMGYFAMKYGPAISSICSYVQK